MRCESRSGSGTLQIQRLTPRMSPEDKVVVRPAIRIAGSVRPPGDKSISHRYAMLAALAPGRTRLQNFASGADCASTVACVAALGCQVQREADRVEIEGLGPQLHAPAAALDCGNSGSTMRMLAGIVAAQPFACEMIGDASLNQRPMARVIAPLTKMGARIKAAQGERPPLRIQGRQLKGIEYELPVASAQVKSCLLFAGLLAEGRTTVIEPARTRDHGELALRAFGAEIQTETKTRGSASIVGGQPLHAVEAAIPGDISSAAFFLCAAAVLPGSNLIVDEVLLNPTRAQLLDVLTQMGARVSVLNIEDRHGEVTGTLQIEAGMLRGARISGALTAALIDELPVLAAIAPFTERGVEIRDARELRVKESDRIAAVAQNLRRMGAGVEELLDGLIIPGGQQLHGAELESAGDHRIVMAFAIAALAAEGESVICGADAARISFPEFFEMLERVSER